MTYGMPHFNIRQGNLISVWTDIDGSKEVGLGINVEKTKYTLLPRQQNRDIKNSKQIV
jgi:hypothetical protein